MNSKWNDAAARAAVEELGPQWGEDLALRTYTSRLIGREPELVLHGGGNTSVKTSRPDLDGRELDVLCVKGSGWDLASIEPPGLPAVELEPLRRLRGLDRLSDEDMVAQVRRRLLDPGAPTPSVETLLHAFLPHRFVDHTHADAVLVLTNQPDGAERVREALGEGVVVLPWIMPGFPLAVAVAEAFERRPDGTGIVLLGHGVFTFGDDARTSYERMIELVDRCEGYARERIGPVPPMLAAKPGDRGERRATLGRVLPVVRGALSLEIGTRWGSTWRRGIAEVRDADDLVSFSAHGDAPALCAQGPLTPDHVIRTKARYLHLTREQAGDPAAVREAVHEYMAWYIGYFQAHRERVRAPVMLSPQPVVVVIEGVGVVAFAPNGKAARIAADIAEHTLRAKARGAALGRYEGLSEGELFEMEYWSLEQAKLGKKQEPLLGGQVALVTGGGGAIGWGIADALLAEGAAVVVTDVDGERLARVEERLRRDHPGAALATGTFDVTDAGDMRSLVEACCLRFGGLDVVVPNAGIARAGRLEELDPQAFRKVLDVNLTGTLNLLAAAVPVLRAQGTGGSVVVQASKNVFEPGAAFGAYSASKAGLHQLGKVAALELAELGVRVNMINADAVFGDDEIPSGLWEEVGPERMKARGLDPEGLREHYRGRSLLGVPVRPQHVGAAVVFFAAARTPTTGATLPVDGGIPGAFPR